MPKQVEVHSHLMVQDDGCVMLALTIPPAEDVKLTVVFYAGLTPSMVTVAHEALSALDNELRAGLRPEVVN